MKEFFFRIGYLAQQGNPHDSRHGAVSPHRHRYTFRLTRKVSRRLADRAGIVSQIDGEVITVVRIGQHVYAWRGAKAWSFAWDAGKGLDAAQLAVGLTPGPVSCLTRGGLDCRSAACLAADVVE